MNKLLFAFAVLISTLAAPARAAGEFATADARAADIEWLIAQIETHYAYLPERQLDLARMRGQYVQQAKAAMTRDGLIHVVENVVAELHDDHVTLGTNTPSSPQLIPTGTDLWAEFGRTGPAIVEVRPGSPAAKAGIRAGDVVMKIGDLGVLRSIATTRPEAMTQHRPEPLNFALRRLLAGTHDAPRRFVLKNAQGKTREVTLAPYSPPDSDKLVTWRWLDQTTGYVRIENSLGDSDTVAAFDDALSKLSTAKNLVFDLRNTPSGGNTDVAEPLMGRFISQTSDYQRIFEPAAGKEFPRDSWVKTLEPRAPLVTAKLIVLVDHWTGSMGEGMAIGFDAMQRAQIVGTPMARLCGGTESFELPNSKIPVHLPAYRLYHVNGTPRENFVPAINVDLAGQKAGDPILARALEALK